MPPAHPSNNLAFRRRTAAEMYEYFERVLDERAVEPTDDLISGFLTAEIEGERLIRTEILDICFLFLIAGLDTVTATLDCFARLSWTRRSPGHRRRPSLIAAAVEELRSETPVCGVPWSRSPIPSWAGPRIKGATR